MGVRFFGAMGVEWIRVNNMRMVHLIFCHFEKFKHIQLAYFIVLWYNVPRRRDRR